MRKDPDPRFQCAHPDIWTRENEISRTEPQAFVVSSVPDPEVGGAGLREVARTATALEIVKRYRTRNRFRTRRRR